MFNGLNNKLANVPTITGLSDVVADTVNTDTLIVDGNDVSVILNQVPINTANISTLQQITTGQSYATLGDVTTFDNNVTLTTGKTMTADNFTGLASNATRIEIAATTSATTFFPVFSATGAGQKELRFNISGNPLSYVPSTNTLTATTFAGNATTATTATNATNATNVALFVDNTAGTYWVPFSKTTSTTSNALFIDTTTTPLSYNPDTSTLTATNFSGLASRATNIDGGIQYQIPYQSNVSTTSFLPNGTSGQILQSNGVSSAPSWVTPSSSTTPTLAQVLVAGNSAGSNNINMNSQSITSATNITSTNLSATNTTTTNINLLTSITPSNGKSVLFNGTPIGNGGNTSSVCMGTNAGPVGTVPNNSFCFGTNSGANLSTGVQNLCIGPNSGNQLNTGRNNTFLGGSAGRKTTTGTYNTQIGSQTQSYPDENLIGSFNTTIGADCYILNDGLSYSTAIGARVEAKTSNTVQIGRSVDNTVFDGTVTFNNNLLLTSPATTLTPTELSYLDGATSNIQAQLNAIPSEYVTLAGTQTITGVKSISTGLSPSASCMDWLDTVTNNRLSFRLNAGGGAFNNLTVAGDSMLLCSNTGPDVGGNLTICPWTNNLSGIRITPTTTFIGVGGASTFPTAGVTCSGTNVQVTGNLSLNQNLIIDDGSGDNCTVSQTNQITHMKSNIVQNTITATALVPSQALNTIVITDGTNPNIVVNQIITGGNQPFFPDWIVSSVNNYTTNITTLGMTVGQVQLASAAPIGTFFTSGIGTNFAAGTYLTALVVPASLIYSISINALNTTLNKVSHTLKNITTNVTKAAAIGNSTFTFTYEGTIRMYSKTSGGVDQVMMSVSDTNTIINACTVLDGGLTMSAGCMYGRDDQFAFLTIPAGGLNQPIGFTTTYYETAVTFTNNTAFNYTTVLPLLDNGVWSVTAYLRLVRGTGTFNVASQIRLSVINSGTTNYYPEPCQTDHPIPNGATAVSVQICMPYTFIVKSTVQERTGIQGFINMAALGTATKQLRMSFTKIA